MKTISQLQTIREFATKLCKKCEDEVHSPSQCHTVLGGHTCCKCLGHEYGDCFNPWQRKKVSYEQYTGEE